MNQEIAHHIEVLVQYVERWNKKDEDQQAAESAQKVEEWLATYREEKEYDSF